MKNASASCLKSASQVAAGTTSVLGRHKTEREYANEFAKIIRFYPAKTLAALTGATEAAAKQWKQGARMPNAGNIFALARGLGRAKAFVFSECDLPDTGAPTRVLEMVWLRLNEMARAPTPEGAMARDILLCILRDAAGQ